MPRLTSSVPKYCKHKASGQAVCTIRGKDFYLGPHKSRASLIEYDRLIGEWLAAGRCLPVEDSDGLAVSELILRYWRFARGYYVKNGQPTDTQSHIRSTLRALREVYGHTQAVDFGPLALRTVREKLMVPGRTRKYVNYQTSIIVRMFKWAVAEQLVPVTVFEALRAVPGLKKRRTTAPEGPGVKPVPEADVQVVLGHLPAIVADMVLVQRLTGCRPSEVCIIRPGDIDRSGDVWTYRPESHKTEHHGKERVIFIGPKAQRLLTPYLLRPAEAYCFDPRESETKRRGRAHANRKTPLSCGNRPGTNRKRRPMRRAGEQYTTSSYRRAIHRACDLAGIDRWGPNRLRHSAATEVRREFGLEAAQVVLGHASADITQTYAERDAELARDVIRRIG